MGGEGGSSPAGGKVSKYQSCNDLRDMLTSVLFTGWLWQRHSQTSYNQTNPRCATAASRCRFQS
jgi:hypothetical protein